jgi:hypothetical protein
MLKPNDFAPFFIKTSFNIPFPKEQRRKPAKVYQDPLFCALYQKIHQIDVTTIEWEQFNEQNEKMKVAEEIEKLKFKNKDTIMNNLMYDKCIGLATLNILCLHFKVNILFVIDRVYVEMKHCDGPVLVMNNLFQFIDMPEETVIERFKVDLEKPLKSISSYKLPELQDISVKLHLPVEKYKKQQLYDSIKITLDKIDLIKS